MRFADYPLTNPYDREERIAIKMESGATEPQAIYETEREMQTNEHEERARQTKCKQVAMHVIQTAANALQGFNDEEWQNLAAQAGTRMPSEISRATIIAMLRDIK